VNPIAGAGLNEWLTQGPSHVRPAALAITEGIMLKWRVLVEEGRRPVTLFELTSFT